MEWNGIEVRLSTHAQERGDKIYTEEDLKKLTHEVELQELEELQEVPLGAGGGPQAVAWANNKRKLIAKLLNCSEEELKYNSITPPSAYTKREMVEEHNTILTCDTTGVLIEEWTGLDFNDFNFYFVTVKGR